MRFIENFLSPIEAAGWLTDLDDPTGVNWQRESFRIFGRDVQAPRKLAWFGDAGLNYRYTGIDHKSVGWPPALAVLKSRVESQAGQRFNFLLLNRYADGSDHMGWHRDDEAGCLGNIASLSIGAPRRFSIDVAGDSHTENRRTLELSTGSLLIFDGRQRHCLRATKKPCDLRINLTFRLISS
jgi:alkylated DNA repair dioxygenase AlkB